MSKVLLSMYATYIIYLLPIQSCFQFFSIKKMLINNDSVYSPQFFTWNKVENMSYLHEAFMNMTDSIYKCQETVLGTQR